MGRGQHLKLNMDRWMDGSSFGYVWRHLVQSFQKKRLELQEKFDKEMDALIKVNENLKQRLEDALADKERTKELLNLEMDDLKEAFDTERKDIEEAFKLEIADIEDQHRDDVEALQDRHDQEKVGKPWSQFHHEDCLSRYWDSHLKDKMVSWSIILLA